MLTQNREGQRLKVHTPRTCNESVDVAYGQAVNSSEPVFVPTSVYTDDRGWSVMNQLQGVLTPEGQVNFSMQYPGTIKAWHRHQHQTDFWMCLTGHVKAGVYCSESNRAWAIVTGEKRPGVMIIPPTLWHGAATVGPVSAGLMYYVTKAYNPASPDEERLSFDAVDGFPWTVENR